MRIPGRSGSIVVLVATLGLAISAAAHADPYEIPARWAGWPSQARPLGTDFRFQCARKLPTAGVAILADHLVLRIADGKPYVTLGWKEGFGDRRPPHWDVAELTDGELVFVGYEYVEPLVVDPQNPWGEPTDPARRGRGYLVRRDRKGDWHEFPSPPVSSSVVSWALGKLVQGRTAGDFYARVSEEERRPPSAPTAWYQMGSPPTRPAHTIYHFTENRWEELPRILPTPAYAVSDLCLSDDGPLLVAGVSLAIEEGGRGYPKSGFAARYRRGAWTVQPLPLPDEKHFDWVAGTVVCGRADRAWLAGVLNRSPDLPVKASRHRRPLLWELDGDRWHLIEIPVPDLPTPEPGGGEPPYTVVSVHAVDAEGRPWISVRPGVFTQDTLFRLEDGVWIPHSLPKVPSVAFYDVESLVFDEAGTGWAIANRWGSAVKPEAYGILLRFDGRAWKHQNWTWSPFRQRWFGLFDGVQ